MPLVGYIEEKMNDYTGQHYFECMKCRDELVTTTEISKIMLHVATCGILKPVTA